MGLKERVVEWAIRVAVLVSLGMGMFTGYRLTALVHCQARYNQQAAIASRARAEAYEQDRAAEDAMWNAFDAARTLPPEQARQRSLEAFQKYLQFRAQANKQRAEHPLPKLPSETCG